MTGTCDIKASMVLVLFSHDQTDNHIQSTDLGPITILFPSP